MLKNKIINMAVVKKVAYALRELNEQVAYLGVQLLVYTQMIRQPKMFVLPRILILCSISFRLLNLLPCNIIWLRKASFRTLRQRSIAVLSMKMY